MSLLAQTRDGARAVFAIAANTLREAVRNKVFGSLMFFASLMLFFSLVLAQMSLHQEVRLVLNVTFFASTIFTMILSVYSSVTLLHTEFERRTIYTILTKPIRRWQFLLGKYLGVLALVTIILVVMSALSALILWTQDAVFSSTFVYAYAALFLQMTIVAALAQCLATFSSPLLSGFATVALFVGGHLFSQLKLIQALLVEKGAGVLAQGLSAVQILLPNLESLNLSEELTYNIAIPASYFGQALWYASSYVLVVLCVGMIIFSRKDFN